MRFELPPFEVTVIGKAELVTNESENSIKLVSELSCQTGIPKLSLRQEVPLAGDLAAYLLSDGKLFQRWTADLNHMLAGRLMDDTLASHALQGVGIALQLLPPLRKPGREKETDDAFIGRVRAALSRLRPEERNSQKRVAAALWPRRDIDEVASYLRRRMRDHKIKNHRALLQKCGYGKRPHPREVTKTSNN